MRSVLLSPIYILALSVFTALAQSPSYQAVGAKPWGTYSGSAIDSVDLSNGNLNLHIPLFSIPQRGGLALTASITYANVGYFTDESCAGPRGSCTYKLYPGSESGAVSPALGTVTAQIDQQYSVQALNADTGQNDGSGDEYYQMQYDLYTSDGAQHNLAYEGNGTFRTVDGSNFAFYTTNQNPLQPIEAGNAYLTESGVVADSHGVQYAIGGFSGVSSITDPDGNEITSNGGWMDTLGRSISNGPTGASSNTSGCPSLTNAPYQPLVGKAIWSIPGFNGPSSSYTFCYTSYLIAADPYPSGGRFSGYTATIASAIQSIVLPDGTYWAFIYDAANPSASTPVGTGSLLTVITPQGGSISYKWTWGGSECQFPVGQTLPSAPTEYTVNPLALYQRTVSDGVNSSLWQYAFGTSGSNYTTTVTQPDQSQIVSTFQDLGSPVPSCMLYETQRQSSSMVNGALVPTQTVTTQYQTNGGYDARQYVAAAPTSITTTWPGAASFVSTKQYDLGQSASSSTCFWLSLSWYCNAGGSTISMFMPTLTVDNDYSGILVRQVNTTYWWQSHSGYLSANILDIPASVTTSSVGGQLAQTTYTYDDSSKVRLAPSPPITTQITTPPNSVYGHVTTTTRWLNGNGSSPVTATYWLNTGEIDHTVDAALNTTHFAYSPSYDGAYMTQSTDAAGESTYLGYDFNTGLRTSYADANNYANNQLTSYSYDSLDRLTSVSYPDGGQTSVTYHGYPTNTAVSTVLMCAGGANCSPEENSGQERTTTNQYDGLGRLIQTSMTDPAGTDITTTAYDLLGRVASVTNPYRTGDSSYGSTSYQYDVLNRMITLTHSPDESGQTWTYSGNTVTMKDENGNQWQRTYDALGRLTRVLEPNGSAQTPSMETDYGYDGLGNLLSVTQWGGVHGSSGSRTRIFVYDSLSRLTSATNPETGTTSYGYLANGSYCAGDMSLSCTKTDARNVVVSYRYDAVNRLLSKIYSSDVEKTPSSCYQYGSSSATNSIGRLANAWTQKWSLSSCTPPPSGSFITLRSISSYDAVGRITGEQQCTPSKCTSASGPSLGYTYDLTGNPTRVTNSVGAHGNSLAVTYGYDSAARRSSVTSSWTAYPTGLFEIGPNGYTAAGQLQNWTQGPSLRVTQGYTTRLWINSITATGQTP